MMDGVFSRLAWKDFRLIRTLVYAIAFAIVACNLATLVFVQTSPLPFSESKDFLSLVWLLMPSIAALGLPAMLVGTEEDNGTMAWLRTLPILRPRIVWSKLIVGLFGFAITWAIATIALQAVLWCMPSNAHEATFENLGFPIGASTYFSLNLLLCGFIANYLLRSPLAALFLTLPLAIIASLLMLAILSLRDRHSVWLGESVDMVLTGVILSLVLVVLQHFLALSRLRPRGKSASSHNAHYSLFNAVGVSMDQNSSATTTHLNLRLSVPKWNAKALQSFAAITCGTTPPTPIRAMLWQAKSQQLMPVVLLTLVASFSLGRWSYIRFSGLFEFVVIPVVMSMCWIGSMTFYVDTIRKRHLYFSERPISRTLVWWTRMLIPASAILIIVAGAWLWTLPYLQKLPFSVGVFGFAICSLVSMAATRPMLGILGGPVLFVFVMSVQASYLNDYIDYLTWSWIAAIPVLFATWRLLPRWKRGHRGLGFGSRVVAYILLGMLCLVVAIYGYRIASIPAEMPQWRAAMLQDNVKLGSVVDSDVAPFDLDKHTKERQDILKRWRLSDSKALADLGKRLLALSTAARQAILDGDLDSSYLFSQIEKDEQMVLVDLFSMRLSVASGLLQSIAPESLRKESREFALKQAWQLYQIRSWRDESRTDALYNEKTFAGLFVGRSVSKHSWERLRADRYVDLAVKETIEYLQAPLADDNATERLNARWRNVYGQSYIGQSYIASVPPVPISLFSDFLIKELRRLVPEGG